MAIRPATEARVGVWALLGLQLLSVVAGIVLLGRMSPAVDHILAENVFSTEAVEDMLASLLTDPTADTFDEALQRARGNITEPEEEPLVDRLEAFEKTLPTPTPAAMGHAVRDLRDLAAVNRGIMRSKGEDASRLGLAGAWALAFTGLVTFLLTVVVTRRIRVRLLGPVAEIEAVLAAARRGDALRRCSLPDEGPRGSEIVANLNWLLDQRSPPEDPGEEDEDAATRRALLALLDGLVEQPALLLGPASQLIGTNAAALGDNVAKLAEEAAANGTPEGWTRRELPRGHTLLLGPEEGGDQA